ncbi:23S rRNA (adenine(2503)-C(2))-methyltransferase RlmN [Candidatus Nomurabacteria bacterium]|nr:23S rRNA (adenine(2503)-C(2))-methyltransferase RlmN [Candidatus Nomurabacteria bacterium]
MDFDHLYKTLADQPKYRVKQAKEAIFKQLVSDWSQSTTLPKELKEQLNQNCSLEIKGQIFSAQKSKTTKALLTLSDGLKIETVLMGHKDGRQTVCVSSQVGCAMACKFCATGKLGLSRNLTYNEIIEQVLFFDRYLKEQNSRVSNIVFMGMGEPFANYDAVLKAIKYFNDSEAFNIGARHISISTSGIIPGIEKLTAEKIQVNLAISLHAANNKLRSELMRINDRFPLEKLLKAVDKYIQKTGRKVMFEYLMIKGVNDSLKHAEELSRLMAKPLHMVNLIPYNPTGVYLPSSQHTIDQFKNYLRKRQVEVSQRYTFGQEIDAACGQLANKAKKVAK